MLSKSLVAWTYTDFEADKSLYLLLAKGFLETGVFAEKVGFANNGNIAYLYNPAIVSPLYSMLAVPFLWLTKSYLVTQFALIIIGWLLFFIALVKVTRLIFRDERLVNIFVLFSGFFLYPHELASTPKDTFAAALVLWSIFFIYQLLKEKASPLSILFCGVSLGCLCLSKLLYVPAALALLLLFSIYAIRKKRREFIIRLGIVLLVLILILSATQFFLIRPAQQAMHITGNSNEVFVRGFFPQNLLQTFPFISSSLIDTNFFGVLVSRTFSLSYSSVIQVFQLADAVLLIMLFYCLLLSRKQVGKFKVTSMLIAVALTLASVPICLSLSLQDFHYHTNGPSWTYVADSRSFLVPMILLQLLLFVFVFQQKQLPFLRGIAVVLLLVNLVHGIYFTAKQSSRLNERPGSAQAASPVKKVMTALVRLEKANGEYGLITSDEILRRYADIKGVRTYMLSGRASNLSWVSKGKHFLIATEFSDSLLRNTLQAGQLETKDTIRPFVLEVYTGR